MILYVNACVRKESRTNKLAKELLDKITTDSSKDVQELNLELEYLSGRMMPLTRESLKKRDMFIEAGDYSDSIFDYAKQFASADTIVMSAPFWDYSIPALLKIYLENVFVTGIVTKYDGGVMPTGLCKAKKLYFVTTAGGPFVPDFGYNYVAGLATQAFGIPETELIMAEMLDIEGNNPEDIIKETIKSIKA